MKKLFFLLAVLILFFAAGNSKEPTLTQTMKRDYYGTFTVRKDNFSPQGYRWERCTHMKESNPLSSLINSNERMIGYLLVNGTNPDSILQRLPKQEQDSIRINRKFQSLLASQEYFARASNQLLDRYFHGSQEPTKTYTLDSLTQLASRFFYAEKFDHQGNIHWKVGATTHGLTHRPLSERDLLAEAFLFEVVTDSYSSSAKGSFRDDMRRIATHVGENTTLPEHPEDPENIEAIRKQFYREFAQLPKLKKAIEKHYRQKMNLLDFTIVPQSN